MGGNLSDDAELFISVVIPTYNSGSLLQETSLELSQELRRFGHPFEVIYVDDGSQDQTWQRLVELRQMHSHVIALRLLKNAGQHSAILAGMSVARGRYIATMDDDGQHAPEELWKLLRVAQEGHDLVFGVPLLYRQRYYRRLGSVVVRSINQSVFGLEPDLRTSSFKLMTKDVAQRIVNFAGNQPYINGEALVYSRTPISVEVLHRSRHTVDSRYSLRRIAALMSRILIGYSNKLIVYTSFVGLLVSAAAFVTGIVLAIRALVNEQPVPGWTSAVVLTSLLFSVTLTSLSIVAAYSHRILIQVQGRPTFIIEERLD